MYPDAVLPSRSLIAAAILATACGSEGAGDDGEAPAVAAEVAPAAEAPGAEPAADDEIRYGDDPDALEALMGDLGRALTAGDDARTARLLASLRLPDYEAWFAATFGERLGERIAADYRPHHDDIGQLAELLGPLLRAPGLRIDAERFARAGDPAATGYQSAALAVMKAREPLYSVRLATGDELFHLWSFVHEGGTFRYVGKLSAAAGTRPPRRGRDPLEFRQRDADRVTADQQPR